MRALSDAEYVQFIVDNPGLTGSLGYTQSAVVLWNGMKILVFVAAQPIQTAQGPFKNVYLSDVSDAPQLQAISDPAYNQQSNSFEYFLPSEIKQSIADLAVSTHSLINAAGEILTSVAGVIGQTAGAAVAPVLSQLTVPIIIGVVILSMMYLPKSHS